MARIELSNIGGGGTTLSLTTTGTSGASTLAGPVLNIPVYQGQLTLTTTGTSGAATLAGDILNIPNYATGGNPAGAAGQVQFNSIPAGSFAASANLAWDNSAVQLNINTPLSPTGKLNVKGSGTLTTVNTRLTDSGNTELLKVLDNGSTNIGANFNWDNVNGRLGLGTSTPAQTLEVSGAMRLTGTAGTANFMLGRNSAGDVSTVTLGTTGTSGAATLSANVLNIPQYQGALTLTTTGTSGAATLSANVLNIPQYSGGGGGSPAGATGEIQYNNAGAFAASANLAWDNTNVRLNIGAPSAPTARLNVRGGGTTSTTATQIWTNSGNTELMRINDAGRVGIGIAPDATALLNVNGSVYSGEFALRTNPTTSYGFSGTQCVLVANGTQGIRVFQGGTIIGTASSIPSFNNCVIRGRNTSVDEFALNVQNSTPTDLYKVENNGRITYWATNTAAGTTGAQTINRPSGTVNFGIGASALVVTNSLCTANSIIFATVRTNDATAYIKNVVPAALGGSFTINLGAAATAETSVGFFIIN